MAREITEIVLDAIFEKGDGNVPGQQRNFNYVVRYSVIDNETGEMLAIDEYRTLASDSPLDEQAVIDEMTNLIETTGT